MLMTRILLGSQANTYFNKGYATQNPKEYFADAYKDYILHRSSLSSTRPLTYKYVKAAVAKVN